MQELVVEQETFKVQEELAKEYPPKHVRQLLLESQVAQGKGHPGMQLLFKS